MAAGGMRVSFEVTGADTVVHRIMGIGERAVDAYPVLEGIVEALKASEAALFDSEDHWSPLKESTLERRGQEGIDTDKILDAFGYLKESLTSDGAGNVTYVGPQELIFGTSVEHAHFHKSGTRHMPKRDPLPSMPEFYFEATQALQAWLVEMDRAAFGAGEFGMASNAGIFG